MVNSLWQEVKKSFTCLIWPYDTFHAWITDCQLKIESHLHCCLNTEWTQIRYCTIQKYMIEVSLTTRGPRKITVCLTVTLLLNCVNYKPNLFKENNSYHLCKDNMDQLFLLKNQWKSCNTNNTFINIIRALQ